MVAAAAIAGTVFEELVLGGAEWMYVLVVHGDPFCNEDGSMNG